MQETITQKTLRVLFVGLKNDYGVPERGLSFEYVNFYDTLARMENVAVTLFPFDEIMCEHGRDKMNQQLLSIVTDMKPDICFFFLFTDEIKKETIQTISNIETVTTINWFTDDHWRFEEYSKWWAPCFNWVVTTDNSAIAKYHRSGYYNVIYSQWAANHYLYKHFDCPIEYDVTFVGQIHSNRKNIINKLLCSGIKVECWGNGWQNGKLSQDAMIKLFSTSKINLNFTDSSIALNFKQLAKLFFNRRADDTYQLHSPKEFFTHLKTMITARRHQIKGRNFEVPLTGGFLLTQYADGIEEYFIPGKEIATFTSVEELCEKIQYYLVHDSEREAIRIAGYNRALKDHTFQKRFNEIFSSIMPKNIYMKR